MSSVLGPTNKSHKHEYQRLIKSECPACKKCPGTQQMAKAESLDLCQDKIPLLLPHQAPICPLGLGWQKQKWEEGQGHFQLNKTEGWNEVKMKEEKTKREG